MIVILILYGLSCGILGFVTSKIIVTNKNRSEIKQLENRVDYYYYLYSNLTKEHFNLKNKLLDLSPLSPVNIKQNKKYKVVFENTTRGGKVYIRLDYASNGLNFLDSETYKNKQFALDKALELSWALNCEFVNNTKIKVRPKEVEND